MIAAPMKKPIAPKITSLVNPAGIFSLRSAPLASN
jgi:hypothetical protein